MQEMVSLPIYFHKTLIIFYKLCLGRNAFCTINDDINESYCCVVLRYLNGIKYSAISKSILGFYD